MAIHNDLPSMAREAIEEYLAVANYCVTARKPDGGVYGYPAVLLLFSVVDALSNYAGHPAHSFLAMKDVVPSLSEKQIKKLADWYRHLQRIKPSSCPEQNSQLMIPAMRLN
jgi:hypothetical protein